MRSAWQVTRVTLAAAALLTCATVEAAAEPGPVMTYLMNEPASLLSIGFLRLNMQLDTFGEQNSFAAGASYVWKTNRIAFRATDIIKGDGEDMEARCKELVYMIRAFAGIEPTTGSPRGTSSYIGDYFRPIGYGLVNEPKDFDQKIDEISEVDANVIGEKEIVSCKGPLLSTEVLFAK